MALAHVYYVAEKTLCLCLHESFRNHFIDMPPCPFAPPHLSLFKKKTIAESNKRQVQLHTFYCE